MTTPQQPVDPDAVAEIAPGQGPEPGSVEYGGSEIHAEIHAETHAGTAGEGDPVTTEAGTFEDLPVSPEEQGE